MADNKISELVAITGANLADADEFVVVDDSAAQTKRITRAELAEGLYQDDNVKAIFGAGSDLQIYHDGSNSYISDQGVGSLWVQATNLIVEATDGSNYLTAVDGGAVKLYYADGASNEKLATTSTGIDVTGTAVTDGVTVAGNLDVSGGTIKLDGNYPLGTNNTGLGDTALESISSGSSNTAIGKNAMNDATTASKNVAVGQGALTSTTSGGQNVALGMSSLAFSTTATNNTASGYQAGYNVTTGSGNSYYGYIAGSAGTVGGANVAVGQNALSANQGGSRNVAIGADALQSFNYGTTNTNTYQVGIGYEALHDATVSLSNTAIGGFALRYSTTASYNTSTGYQSSYNTTTGQYNVGNGYRSLYSNTTSSFNTTVGTIAGYSSTGGYNTFLGYGAGYHVSTGSKNTVVGLYNGNQGGLDIRTSSNYIVLSDGDGNPRQVIDGSGNLLVGQSSTTTPVSSNVVGTALQSTGRLEITCDGNTPIRLNRKTSDGSISQYRKDGTVVGSIGTDGGNFYIEGGTNISGLHFRGADILPRDNGALDAADTISLGNTGYRFNNLYLSGGVYLGGTGSANKMDDVEFGTWTPGSVTGTISASYANYAKVGRLVTVSAAVGNFSDRTSTSAVSITGLPFTSSSSQASVGGVFGRNIDRTTTNASYVANSTSNVLFYNLTSANWGALTHAELNSSSAYLYFTVTYLTDA